MSFDIEFVECNNDSAIEALLPIIKKHFDFEKEMILKRNGKIHHFLEDFEESKDYYFTLDHLVATCPSGDIIGILSFDLSGSETFISVMYVEEECRRQGVGKALFEKLKEKCGKREDFALGVDINNTETIAFYQSLGFINTLVTMNYVAPEVNNVREVVALKFNVPSSRTGKTYRFNEEVKCTVKDSLDRMIGNKGVGIVTPIQYIARQKRTLNWPKVGVLLGYRFINEETDSPKLLVTIDFTDKAIEKLNNDNYGIAPVMHGTLNIVGDDHLFTITKFTHLDVTIVENNPEAEKEINDACGKWHVNEFITSFKEAWEKGESTTVILRNPEKTDKEIKTKDFYLSDNFLERLEEIGKEINDFLLVESAKIMKLKSCHTRYGYKFTVEYVH